MLFLRSSARRETVVDKAREELRNGEAEDAAGCNVLESSAVPRLDMDALTIIISMGIFDDLIGRLCSHRDCNCVDSQQWTWYIWRRQESRIQDPRNWFTFCQYLEQKSYALLFAGTGSTLLRASWRLHCCVSRLAWAIHPCVVEPIAAARRNQAALCRAASQPTLDLLGNVKLAQLEIVLLETSHCQPLPSLLSAAHTETTFKKANHGYPSK